MVIEVLIVNKDKVQNEEIAACVKAYELKPIVLESPTEALLMVGNGKPQVAIVGDTHDHHYKSGLAFGRALVERVPNIFAIYLTENATSGLVLKANHAGFRVVCDKRDGISGLDSALGEWFWVKKFSNTLVAANDPIFSVPGLRPNGNLSQIENGLKISLENVRNSTITIIFPTAAEFPSDALPERQKFQNARPENTNATKAFLTKITENATFASCIGSLQGQMFNWLEALFDWVRKLRR